MSNKSNSSSGIGLTGALFLVLLVLKLTGYIDWSWWWVTAPLWGGVALVLAIVIFIFGGYYLFKSDKTIPKPRPKPKSRFQEKLEKLAEERGYKNN